MLISKYEGSNIEIIYFGVVIHKSLCNKINNTQYYYILLLAEINY